VCLHSRHMVHFFPSLSPDPFSDFSEGLVPRGVDGEKGQNVCLEGVGASAEPCTSPCLILLVCTCAHIVSFKACHTEVEEVGTSVSKLEEVGHVTVSECGKGG